MPLVFFPSFDTSMHLHFVGILVTFDILTVLATFAALGVICCCLFWFVIDSMIFTIRQDFTVDIVLLWCFMFIIHVYYVYFDVLLSCTYFLCM